MERAKGPVSEFSFTGFAWPQMKFDENAVRGFADLAANPHANFRINYVVSASSASPHVSDE